MFNVTAKVPCPTCGVGEDDPCRDSEEWHSARKEAASKRLTRARRGEAKLYEWSEPAEFPGCFCIAGEECTIWLQRRPGYCDRGRWHATVDAWGKLGASLDDADGWPRYYMNLEIGKVECLAWLRHREQCIRENRTSSYDRVKMACIVCGALASPLRIHDFHILFCTRHALDFCFRLGPVTVTMLQEFEAAASNGPPCK